MAVALQTKTDPTYEGNGAGENITITHSSGLTAGDLMIVCLAEVDADNNVTPAIPTSSGWTQIATQTQTSPGPARLTALYKVASAGDVSAGSTIFSLGIGGTDDVWVGGSFYRIDGQGDGASIQSSIATGAAGTSHSFTGLTPVFANSLLLFFVAQFPSSTGTFSSQAITTDNPSWTEQFDSYGDSTGYGGADDIIFSGATATRPETTATGNATVTSTNSSESIGLLIAVPPLTNASTTGSVGSLSLTGNVGTAVGNATASGSVGSLSLTGNVGTASAVDAVWVNEQKS